MSIHMKKGKKRTEGFTLVELICVIAILGILVAIAVPSYRGIQDKSAEQVAISPMPDPIIHWERHSRTCWTRVS